MSDRLGDVQRALLWHHAAFSFFSSNEGNVFEDCYRVGKDLVLARYAQLLTDSGELEAAAAVLVALGECCAGSLGESIAQRTLSQRVPVNLNSKQRVFGRWVYTGSPGTAYQWYLVDRYAFVLGDPEEPSSWRPLAYSIKRKEFAEREAAPADSVDILIVTPDDSRAQQIAQDFDQLVATLSKSSVK